MQQAYSFRLLIFFVYSSTVGDPPMVVTSAHTCAHR
jgi:hypothetical protein